jgi:hypothetical protein
MDSKKEMYERKAAYTERKMRENAENENLTEEQHDVLAWLCSVRHDFHCNYSDLFNSESSHVFFEPFDNFGKECEVNQKLEDTGLPKIPFSYNSWYIPVEDDYYSVLDDKEREEWEKKAEEWNTENPTQMSHSGCSFWKEESGAYAEFIDIMEGINSAMENYLLEIDKKYGTNYCPSGMSRLK